jgi:hypothetical protein
MAKKLPIIDPYTGLEIVEHHVLKTAANHTELEGQTFGLGPETNFLNITTADKKFNNSNKKRKKITARSTPNLNSDVDRTTCLFPPTPTGTEVFLNHIEFSDTSKQDSTYVYETNRPFRYKNGQIGLSHSLSILPCMSHKDTFKKRRSWKDRPVPDYIYNDKGIRNRELTFYLKVGKPVNETALKRVAVRLGGAWNTGNPTLRSYLEIGYPTQDYPDIYFCVAYAAGRNVLVRTVNQYFVGDRIVPDRWIGLKIVSQVADNNSHIWYGVYVDLSPFASSEDNDDKRNNIPLNNWQLKADLIFTGVKEYANIVPTWKCEVDSIIVEGYDSATFKGVSDREVDFMGLKPLHQDMSVIAQQQSDKLLFRKAMIPSINLDDFEALEDMMNVEKEEENTTTTTTTTTSRKASHTTLSLPRSNRDSNPKDPAFYGVYTH